MKRIQARLIGWTTLILGLLVLSASGWVLKDIALERWWIWQLDSQEEQKVIIALDRLEGLRSVRAVPKILDMIKSADPGSIGSHLGTKMWEVVLNLGPQAMVEIVKVTDPDIREKFLSNFGVEIAGEENIHPIHLFYPCLANPDEKVRLATFEWLHSFSWKWERLPASISVAAEIVETLDDSSEKVRMLSACLLYRKLPTHPKVRAFVQKALVCPQYSIRKAAVNAACDWSNYWGEFSLNEMLQCLKDPVEEMRSLAATFLGYKRCAEAFPELVAILENDQESFVTEGTVSGLGLLAESLAEELPFEKALPALQKLLLGNEPVMIWGILKVFEKMGMRSRPAEGGVQQLFHQDQRYRAEAAIALCSMGACSREIVSVLIDEIDKGDYWKWSGDDAGPLIRLNLDDILEIHAFPRLLAVLDMEVAWSSRQKNAAILSGLLFSSFSDGMEKKIPFAEEVYNRLACMLQDPHEESDFRYYAAGAIQKCRFGAEKTRIVLTALMEDPGESDGLRAEAAESLGDMGTLAGQSLPALFKVAGEKKGIGRTAAISIGKIDPNRFAESAQLINGALLEDGINANFEWSLIGEICYLGIHAKDAIPGLIKVIQNDSGRLEPALDFPLSWIGKPAVPALRELLRSDNIQWRSQAAEALGWIGPGAEEAASDLQIALKDEHADVRRHAEWAAPRVAALQNMQQPPPLPIPGSAILTPLLHSDEGWSEGASPEAWQQQRGEIRKQWLHFLGEPAKERGPLQLEILTFGERPLFYRRHVRYRIEEGVYADGHLLLPKLPILPAGARRPAAVVFHSTVESGAEQPAGLDPSCSALAIGAHLAERGYVVLCPRCFIFTEKESYADNVEKMKERHPGWKGMSRMLLDALRAVDLLETLPEVDPSRIGCIGHSLGAKEALYSAAFDDRIQAAVFSEGGIGLSFSNWDAPWYLGPAIRERNFPLEHHQLLALIAPRSFLLLAGDSADGPASWGFLEAALPVYRLLGAGGNIGWVRHRQGHAYPWLARASAQEFLDRCLKN